MQLFTGLLDHTFGTTICQNLTDLDFLMINGLTVAAIIITLTVYNFWIKS